MKLIDWRKEQKEKYLAYFSSSICLSSAMDLDNNNLS